jgi:hypothetical protein
VAETMIKAKIANPNIYAKEREVLHRHPLKPPDFVGTTPFFGIAVSLY